MASPRHILSVVLALAAVGCRPAGEPVRVVSMLTEFERADKRPAAGFDVAVRTVDGIARPALVAPVPSRATWRLSLPRRGVFRAFVAADTYNPSGTIRLRVGVSDERIYEALAYQVVSTEQRKWAELRVDLSAYAGFKWSLFYRPEQMTWHVVLGADPLHGTVPHALWGAPEILTDSIAAREYRRRRQTLR